MSTIVLGLICIISGFLAGIIWGSEGFKRRHAKDWHALLETDSST